MEQAIEYSFSFHMLLIQARRQGHVGLGWICSTSPELVSYVVDVVDNDDDSDRYLSEVAIVQPMILRPCTVQSSKNHRLCQHNEDDVEQNEQMFA